MRRRLFLLELCVMVLGLAFASVLCGVLVLTRYERALEEHELTAEFATADQEVENRRGQVVAGGICPDEEVIRKGVPPDIKDFDPEPIHETAGLFLVQSSSIIEPFALLIDHQGKLLFRFSHSIRDVLAEGDDWIILTRNQVVRGAADGTIRWTTSFSNEHIGGYGSLVRLEGGDCLAYGHCWLRDYGVDLLRFDPNQGIAHWRTHCSGLQVRWSDDPSPPLVKVKGSRLTVVHSGSRGKYAELIDLGSGRQILRKEQSYFRSPPPRPSFWTVLGL
jgi:hypothetical protein